MKTGLEVCRICLNPTKISRRAQRIWNEQIAESFVCNVCLKARIDDAVAHAALAKEDSTLRAKAAVLQADYTAMLKQKFMKKYQPPTPNP